jgi:outer membrane protein
MKLPIEFCRGPFALLALVTLTPAVAAELPLWEVGLGIGVANSYDYRGSDQRHTFVLPTPYIVYRGDRLRVDRRGVRGELFETERVSVDITANLGTPTDSSSNQARAGMPNLDWTLQIGPSFNWRFYENNARDFLLSLRLPLRAAITLDSHPEYIGWVFLPHIAADFLNVVPGWRVGLSAGPIYASNQYHDYYYAVQPEFATASRPAYDPPGGYSGASVGLTVSKRFKNYWVGAFYRYDDLHHVVFEDSPLVRTKHAGVGGIAVSWIFYRSPQTVKGSDTEIDP